MEPNLLRWDHTPEEIVRLTDSSLVEWTGIVDGMINLKEARTFQNTIEPLSKFEHNCFSISNNIKFYTYVSTSKELREASLAAGKKFDDFFIESWFNYELYQAIYKYKQTSVESKEWETLDSES